MRAARALSFVFVGLVAACRVVDAPVAPQPSLGLSAAPSSNEAAGYIVTFDDSVQNPAGLASQLATSYGVSPRFVYRSALKGFAAPLSAQAATALSHHPAVRRVEADAMAYASGTQSGATWGLDRLDQRALPMNSTYAYNYTGVGVTAYIIDTGIRTDHVEFWTSATNSSSRATIGVDEMGDGQNGADCNGHGTHVSGTVGGLTYGVAKAVRLVAVRVLGCNGSGAWSGIIAGLDWIVSDHLAGEPAVANMSLGGLFSQSANDAVQRAIADGVVMAVAAGNQNADACGYSPASAPAAITVGASDAADTKANFSNHGGCVDWFAPGVSILSSYNSSSTATAVLSGTSMASPHTAGAAALYLEAYPGSTPNDVRDGLYGLTTKDIVLAANSANDHLLYTAEIGSAAPPPPPPPPPAPSLDVIALQASLRVKGTYRIDLAWSGSTAASVDVFRNGTKVATVANGGAYTDNLGKKTGTYVHKVCNAATTTCSNTTTTTY